MPIVSIDGWLAIINRQPDYDGLTIRFSEKEIEIGGVKIPEYCECSIRRKGMSQPITIPEYARECYQKTMVWGSYPRRMLRHKAIIQCARVAFGLSGIYDEDEGQNIIDAEELNAAPAKAASRSEKTLPAAQPKRSLAVSSRDEMNELSTVASTWPLRTAIGLLRTNGYLNPSVERNLNMQDSTSRLPSRIKLLNTLKRRFPRMSTTFRRHRLRK